MIAVLSSQNRMLSIPRPLLRKLMLRLQTCSSFFLMNNQFSPFLVPCSASCSPPNFANYSSRKSVSADANYLKSHFFAFQPKALRSRARDYLSLICWDFCSDESRSSFCSPLVSCQILDVAANDFSFTATGQDRVDCFMMKHLLCSVIDLLFDTLNLFSSVYFFLSI